MTAALVRYLGVYDADGGLAGELRYVIGHLLGTAECALCDITHSPVRRKPAWDRMVATLGVPFDLRHRNELTTTERTATAAMRLPYVAAELDDGTYVEVLGVEALTACEGDPEQLRTRLLAAAPDAATRDAADPDAAGPDAAGLTTYDLIIVGAGSGNMLPDDSTADWRVAIVESDRFGGTCLNRGCIPSKMFVYAADVARHARDGQRFGVATRFDGADWPAIRDRVFSRIDPIHDDAVDYRRRNGIDVHLGAARFVAPKVLEVDGRRITAERIVVAAGTRPFVPPIDGIDRIEALTSDDVMRIDTLPASMLVLGGGVIAAEMGHVFASLGTHVTWVHRGRELLEGQHLGLDATHQHVDLSATGQANGERVPVGETEPCASAPFSDEHLLRERDHRRLDAAARHVPDDAAVGVHGERRARGARGGARRPDHRGDREGAALPVPGEQRIDLVTHRRAPRVRCGRDGRPGRERVMPPRLPYGSGGVPVRWAAQRARHGG